MERQSRIAARLMQGDDISPIDTANAQHYVWGNVCEGWRLLEHPDLSVIQERVPPGAGEIKHRHRRARQFFYVLSGSAALEIDGTTVAFTAGQGVHVPPGIPHRFVNTSNADTIFLVISSPTTAGDRANV